MDLTMMERIGDRNKMEGSCSTGQSPQQCQWKKKKKKKKKKTRKNKRKKKKRRKRKMRKKKRKKRRRRRRRRKRRRRIRRRKKENSPPKELRLKNSIYPAFTLAYKYLWTTVANENCIHGPIQKKFNSRDPHLISLHC
jgi:hypothetical protein